jgi:hypothetical protein
MPFRIIAIFLATIYFGNFLCPESVEAGWFSSSFKRVFARKAPERDTAKQAAEKVAEKKAAAQKAVRQFEEGKVSEKAKNEKLMTWDQARDKTIPVKPLEKSRTVYRYTSMKQAKIEQANGISPNTHMTSREVGPGRPLSAVTAKGRYGLPNEPQAQLKIQIPAHQPIRNAKVVGGKAGYGEITSPKSIPSKSVIQVRGKH